MNRDIAQGMWKQVKGKVREQWGQLTDDEIDQMQGRYERLVGKIQEKYGRSRDAAEKEVDKFLEHYGAGSDRVSEERTN